ncbi:relaxase/mobilization nuclease domain-containing protein [Parapedobacter sp. 10938]|uniref:relaxase/mobilization nuclease domain-containing protein n=1 Tax=Parapedobacter flavus TaxID=3110225 RepID=UPI002DBC0B8B|nr:relaxase/mobilization nuclease domain-containing protein [Parapedobacter sp. 10938]MEC3881823.1 relaxase/mobilization nuclease domain-containing protein [Parapedobacter sp. 10938]
MIAKISHGCNVVSLIEYHEQKVNKGTATLLHAQQFLRPNKQIYKAVFDEYISHSRMENPTFHASINLPPGEHINRETFLSVAKDYMDGLGYGHQPYVIYHHHDRPHDHIHIISVNVQENGKRIETYYQHNKSQELTRELEKKYNLTVVPNRKPTERERMDTADLTTRSGIKSFIARTNRDVLQNYNPASFVEYKKLLALHNVTVEKVTNPEDDATGYMLQVNDQPHTVKIKGSELYYRFNESVLERNFAKGAVAKSKYNVRELSSTVYNALRNYDQINYSDFASTLKEQGIDVVYDRYKNGNIYGISFVDHNSGVILKGSEVHRNYTVGKLKETVNDGPTRKKLTSLLYDAYYTGYSEYRKSNFNADQLKYIDCGKPAEDICAFLREQFPGRGEEATPRVVGSFLADRKVAVRKNMEKLQKLKSLNVALEKYFKEDYTKTKQKGQTANKFEYIETVFNDRFQTIRGQVMADDSVKAVLSSIDAKTIDKQFQLFKERKHKDRFRIDFQDTLNAHTKDVVNQICLPSKGESNREIFLALTDSGNTGSRELLRDSALMAIKEYSREEAASSSLIQAETDAITEKQASFVSDMIVKRYANAALKDEIAKVIKDGYSSYRQNHEKETPDSKPRYSSYLGSIAASPGAITMEIAAKQEVKELGLEEHLKQSLDKTIETTIRAKAKVVPLIRIQEDLDQALRKEAKELSSAEKAKISEVFSDDIYVDALSQSMLDRVRKHDEYANAVRNLGEESVDRSLRTFLSRNIQQIAGWYENYVPYVATEYKYNPFDGLIGQFLAGLGQSKGSGVGKNTARNDRRRTPRI